MNASNKKSISFLLYNIYFIISFECYLSYSPMTLQRMSKGVYVTMFLIVYK